MKNTFSQITPYFIILFVLLFFSGCQRKTPADFTKLKALPTSNMKMVTDEKLGISVLIPKSTKLKTMEKNIEELEQRLLENLPKLTHLLPKKMKKKAEQGSLEMKKMMKESRKEMVKIMGRVVTINYPEGQSSVSISFKAKSIANSSKKVSVSSTKRPSALSISGLPSKKEDGSIFFQKASKGRTSAAYSLNIFPLFPTTYIATTHIKRKHGVLYCTGTTQVFGSLKTLQKICESIQFLKKASTQKSPKSS